MWDIFQLAVLFSYQIFNDQCNFEMLGDFYEYSSQIYTEREILTFVTLD